MGRSRKTGVPNSAGPGPSHQCPVSISDQFAHLGNVPRFVLMTDGCAHRHLDEEVFTIMAMLLLTGTPATGFRLEPVMSFEEFQVAEPV
jgi:hypothetical protein